MKKKKRLSAERVQTDKKAYNGLEHIVDFRPANQRYTRAKGKPLIEKLQKEEDEFQKAEEIYQEAREKIIAVEQEFHAYMKGIKKQVVAQFGDDSDEIAKLGLKKVSNYKSRKHKPKDEAKK